MSRLRELLDKLQLYKDRKFKTGQIRSDYMRESQLRTANNMIAHYEDSISKFGGGLPIYSIRYKYVNAGNKTEWYQEFYQAETKEEAYAACTLHNIHKVDFEILTVMEYQLRNPQKIIK